MLRPAGQGLESSPEPDGPGRVGLAPLGNPADEQAELLYRLRHLLPGGRVPGSPMLAVSAGKRLQPGRGPGDLRLAGHERRAPQHPGAAQELVGGRRLRLRDQRLQPVQALTSLQREEVGGPEGIGH